MSNILKNDEVAAELAKQEQSAWKSANSTATEESYQGYLNTYPTGSHATQAQACIAKLKKEAAQAKSLGESVEWIKTQGGIRHDTNIESSNCYGPVQKADDLHAIQHIGQKEFIIHVQQLLSTRLAVGDNAGVLYRNGLGKVTVKEKSSQEVGL